MSIHHLLGIPDLPLPAFRRKPGSKAPLTLEGGKNSYPPPDPRLVDAQIKSMGVQDQVMSMIMDNSKEFMPLQKQQMQLGLDAARRAYQQSQDDREWMLGRRGQLSGLQDRLTADANSFNTEDRRSELAGEAMGDVNQAFSNARGQADRDLARMGVNPNDGRQAAVSGQLAAQQALGLATAGNKARQQARQEGYALTDRATNALAGYPAMGMQATGAGAGYGGMGLQLANTGLAGMNSGLLAAGGMAGQMGSNATNMWGAQQSAYQNAQNADNAAWGGLGSAIGGIGSALIM